MAIKFLKNKMQQQSLEVVKNLLHKIAGFEEPREDVTIHASDVARTPEYCPRDVILRRVLKKKRKSEYIDICLRTTFDAGNDIQARINNEYLREYMVGNWKCLACGMKSKFTKAPKGGCGHSQTYHNECRWEYVETVWRHEETGMVGSVDALLDHGPSGLIPVEVKIINPTDWKKLKMPLAEHSVRTRLYLRLIAESDSPLSEHVNTDVAHVLYVCRTFGFKQADGKMSPYKDFALKRKDSDTDYLIDKARAVAEAQQAGKVPYGVCDSMNCTRAKNCPVKGECFSGAYGPVQPIAVGG